MGGGFRAELAQRCRCATAARQHRPPRDSTARLQRSTCECGGGQGCGRAGAGLDGARGTGERGEAQNNRRMWTEEGLTGALRQGLCPDDEERA